MSIKFDSLKSEINECFYEIVGILNEVIEQRTDTFSDMLDVSGDIQKGSETFVNETDRIVGEIAEDINSRIDSLDMNKMKQEIVDATATFIAITEELELLSYNTICRTMALGEKGATITHISKEIKKYSTTVKTLLDVITSSFNEMFDKFRNVSEHLKNNQLKAGDSTFGISSFDEFTISSDASALIEDSQFHDIFMQELEIINDAVSNTSYSTPYEAGIIFGTYEKATSKLDFIKYSLQDKLEGIKNVMGDFIYNFNTDLQNIAGHTNILRSELNRVEEVSERVCTTISMLKNTVNETSSVIKNTRDSINRLLKQSKTFRNLVVITAVEVARINDGSLRSVVVSMTQTEDELHRLIDKLLNNVDMWECLRGDFLSAFTGAEDDMQVLCHSSVAEERKNILSSTRKLDDQLHSFREVFMADKYVHFFDTSTEHLMTLFTEFNDSIQQIFLDFNNTLGDDILSDDEFTRGRNEADIKDILAQEEEQSSIEFF